MEDDTNSTPAAQWTHDELERNLSRLSEASFRNRTIVVVYLSLVSIVGFLGNTLVLLVYGLRFKPSATRIFVLFMAYLDIATCTIALPVQIYTIRYAYDSDLLSCRILMATSTLTTQASGFVLALVAMDRFRRICLPLKKQQNARQALYFSTATVSIAFGIFAPFIPYYGTHHTNITTSTIEVTMCWSYDKYGHTLYPILYKIIVGIAFWAGLAIMVICYICVGAKVWKQKVHGKENRKVSVNTSDNEAEATTSMSGRFIIPHFILQKYPGKKNSGKGSKCNSIQRSSQPDQEKCQITSETEVAADSPQADKFKIAQSTADSPLADKFKIAQSTADSPLADKFKIAQSTADSPLADKFKIAQSTADSPLADKFKIAQSTADSPLADKFKIAQSTADSPLADKFKIAQSNLQKSPKKQNSGIGSECTSIQPSDQSDQPSVSDAFFFQSRSTFLEKLKVDRAGNDDASKVPLQVSSPLSSSSSSSNSQVRIGQRPADKSTHCSNPKTKSTVQIVLPLSHSSMSERETAPVRTYASRIRRQTTLMMCVLTICYILNWLPHFIARAITTDPVNLCDNYTDCGYNMYALSLRSYYLNGIVNAFVYFFCNQQFRRESGKLYRGFLKRLRIRH